MGLNNNSWAMSTVGGRLNVSLKIDNTRRARDALGESALSEADDLAHGAEQDNAKVAGLLVRSGADCTCTGRIELLAGRA